MTALLDWYNRYSEYIIAIYTYGSRANPYIENPDDYDYAVFAKDMDSYHFLNSHRHDLDDEHIHIALFCASSFDGKPKKAGDYIHYFMSPIIGFFPCANYNILYLEEEYLAVLRMLAPTFPYINTEDGSGMVSTNKR